MTFLSRKMSSLFILFWVCNKMFLKLYFRLFFFCIDGVFDNENENYPAGIEIVVKDKNLKVSDDDV